jgi:hypothetical protein
MRKHYWRDLIRRGPNDELWREVVPATVADDEVFDYVLQKAEEEWDEEELGALLVKANRQGRVHVDPLVVDGAPKTQNKGGAPSKVGERLELMKALLLKRKGDERQAKEDFVLTIAAERTGRNEKGLKGHKHAVDVWHDLRPLLGDWRSDGGKSGET